MSTAGHVGQVGEVGSEALVILVAGEPIDAVRRARGDYTDIIRTALGEAWP